MPAKHGSSGTGRLHAACKRFACITPRFQGTHGSPSNCPSHTATGAKSAKGVSMLGGYHLQAGQGFSQNKVSTSRFVPSAHWRTSGTPVGREQENNPARHE
eukprot:1157118-Pelagomonas_calceolata.AAC.19